MGGKRCGLSGNYFSNNGEKMTIDEFGAFCEKDQELRPLWRMLKVTAMQLHPALVLRGMQIQQSLHETVAELAKRDQLTQEFEDSRHNLEYLCQKRAIKVPYLDCVVICSQYRG